MLIEAVKRIKPKVHVFGHIHEAYGEITIDGTRFINACSCSLRYKIEHPPVIVDFPILVKNNGPKIYDMTGLTVEEEEKKKAKEQEEDDDDEESEGSASDQEDYEVEDEDF
jgi:hypothetical protein